MWSLQGEKDSAVGRIEGLAFRAERKARPGGSIKKTKVCCGN